jgi:hypothetical protein
MLVKSKGIDNPNPRNITLYDLHQFILTLPKKDLYHHRYRLKQVNKDHKEMTKDNHNQREQYLNNLVADLQEN